MSGQFNSGAMKRIAFWNFLYKYCRRPERCIHNTPFVTFLITSQSY